MSITGVKLIPVFWILHHHRHHHHHSDSPNKPTEGTTACRHLPLSSSQPRAPCNFLWLASLTGTTDPGALGREASFMPSLLALEDSGYVCALPPAPSRKLPAGARRLRKLEWGKGEDLHLTALVCVFLIKKVQALS